MKPILVENAFIVNEGIKFKGSILISGDRIHKIYKDNDSVKEAIAHFNPEIINADGLYCIPGLIDTHVHFREPGLTHKADMASESSAAVAGGVTSIAEMPNTIPPAVTLQEVERKYEIASRNCLCNHAFYIGATNENIPDLVRLKADDVFAVKLFMGSSTGGMLVDDDKALTQLFAECAVPIAIHAEDEQIIKANTERYRRKFGDDVAFHYHAEIRSTEACFRSTLKAVNLAYKYNTRIHLLHISTGNELCLLPQFNPKSPHFITCEVCVHHLWFDKNDYDRLGGLIKCNPSIKFSFDRQDLRLNAIFKDTKIATFATDHAPHTLEEKRRSYFECPSGIAYIQYALPALLELVDRYELKWETVVDKMCHNPAIIFGIKDRGYIREGYYADLVLVKPNSKWTARNETCLSKCKWSPFDGYAFNNEVLTTFVNGNIVYNNRQIVSKQPGKRIELCR